MDHTHAIKLSTKKRLFSGVAWALPGKVATSLTGLAISALLARLLRPDELGVYFLTFSVVSVAIVLAQMGLNHTVVRLVAEAMGLKRPDRARGVVQAVFWLGAAGAAVVALLYLLAGDWIGDTLFHSIAMADVTGLVAVWIAVVTLQSLLPEAFRGFHDIPLATIFGGLTSGILSTVFFALLWWWQGRADLRQVVVLSVGAGAISVVLASILLRRKVAALGKGITVQAREVLRVTWPLLVTNLTFFALTQADLWIIGIFCPQEDVAVYGAAAKLVTLVAMPLLVVNAVVPPLIAEMYSQGKKKDLQQALRGTATIAGLPAFVVLLGFMFFGGPILGMVYGKFFQEGTMVLAILSVGQLVNVWVGSCGLTLMMTGYQTTMMTITIASGFVTLVIALAIVGKYGATGVAMATAAGLVLQNISMWLGARLTTGLWTHLGIMEIIRFSRIRK